MNNVNIHSKKMSISPLTIKLALKKTLDDFFIPLLNQTTNQIILRIDKI